MKDVSQPSPATVRALSELNAGKVVVTRNGCAFKVGNLFRAVINSVSSDHATPEAALAALRPVVRSYLD